MSRTPFPRVFWVGNGIEILERFAYYGLYMGFQIFATNARLNHDGEPLSDSDRYALMSREQRYRDRRLDQPLIRPVRRLPGRCKQRIKKTQHCFSPLPAGQTTDCR